MRAIRQAVGTSRPRVAEEATFCSGYPELARTIDRFGRGVVSLVARHGWTLWSADAWHVVCTARSSGIVDHMSPASAAQVLSDQTTPSPSAMPRPPTRWIISPRDDLVFFIGSAALSYLFLGAHFLAGVSIVTLYWGWLLFFDGPHAFTTLSRTYLDTQEWTRRAGLLLGSLGFFALGPLCVTNGLGPIFFPLAGIAAYHHVVRQHYGFMVIYKAKNGDLQRVDNLIDRAFLVVALYQPFVLFILHDAGARRALPFVVSGRLTAMIDTVLWALLAVAATIFLFRQMQRLLRRDALDLPKYLLLLAVVPMHFLVLRLDLGPTWVAIFFTINHNVQYQRFVWFYNQNRYRIPDGAARFGPAAWVSQNIGRFLVCGVVFAGTYYLPNYLLRPSQIAAGFFWGLAFVHYFLDAKIWHVRGDPELARTLRLGTA